MERLIERLTLAKSALAAFAEVLQLPYSKIIRDAAIQRFEFTVEAVWKLAQRYLVRYEGLEIGSPKGVVRACLQSGLLEEQQTTILLTAIDDRNLTAHTYNEKLAEHIYKNLFRYQPLLEILCSNIEKRIKSSTDKR